MAAYTLSSLNAKRLQQLADDILDVTKVEIVISERSEIPYTLSHIKQAYERN